MSGLPETKDLLKLHCNGSTTLCIPYGGCCTMDEYCDLRRRECVSCFPPSLKTNDSKLEFCHNAQFDVSQMVHASCVGACDTWFGRKTFMGKQAESAEMNPENNEVWKFLFIGALCLIGVMMVLIVCLVKKKRQQQRSTIHFERGQEGIAFSSKEDVDVKQAGLLHQVMITPDVETLNLQNLQQMAPHGQGDGGVETTQLLGRDDQSEGGAQRERSRHQEEEAGTPDRVHKDQAKNRAMHLNETDHNLPAEIAPSGGSRRNHQDHYRSARHETGHEV